MKKLLIFVFTALIFGACSEKNQFQIDGEIVPATEGKLIIHKIQEGKPVAVDSADIVSALFNFKGDINMPELYLLSIEGQQNYIAQYFADKGNISMTIYPDSFETNVIEGSAAQDIYKIYMDELVEFTKSQEELGKRFGVAQASGNTEEIDGIRFEYETIVDNIQLYSRNFINEYVESPVAAYVYLMNFYQQADLQELDSMLLRFDPIKESDLVAAISDKAEALRASEEGAVAPDFTLKTDKDEDFTLSSLRGKYVLVDFWASWCRPCMEEMPNVIEQYEAFKDKGFEIVGVSLDRDQNAWLNTILIKKMKWIQVWDMDGETPGEVANKYGVTGIPYTLLLDKEGKIIAKNLRGEALKEKLEEVLN